MSSDDEWRFATDEVGETATQDDRPDERTDERTVDGHADADRRQTGEGVLGRNDGEFADPEPQSVAAENVFFVVLGAMTMVGIIALLVV
ncbi:hypothetical protein ACFPYI_04945 [Halomarina salina]|uniref:DUF7312 domain-containing protein n=1 Tax=Halomarina salina TaxID=1872699 RepID=A0ABD5RJK1_9EURY|nr:hypothetical protein [Halomarina salina]